MNDEFIDKFSKNPMTEIF